MNTLSDKLTFTVSYTAPTADTYYTYYISTTSSYVNAIYKGRFFAAKGSTSVTIYINDILASERPTHNILKDYIRYVVPSEYQLVKRYYILAYVPAVTTQYMDVLLTYKYPYKDYEMGGIEIGSTGVMPLLQGVENYDANNLDKQTMILYPKYPSAGNKSFMVTQAFCDALNFAADSTKMVTLDASNNVVKQLYSVLWDEYTSRVAIQDSDIPISTTATGIGIQNKAIGEETIITGKRLWKIEVNDQWEEGDASIIAVAENLGYDSFYADHFAVYDETANTMHIYFVYETNDQADIDKAFEDAGCTYQYNYTEEETVDLYDIAYDGKIVTLSEDNFNDFTRFMEESCELDEEFVREKMGIYPGINFNLTFRFHLPYKICDEEQVQAFQTYFEAFEGTGTYTYADFFYEDSANIEAYETYEETYKETTTTKCIRFADIDDCPAHYYLQWIDRFGGVQCLPFDKKETKTIGYDKTYISNQYNEQRLINSNDTLQFELNSGWLKDEYMPIYEGIYVSPYLRLYDTEADKVYDVISVDEEYTEKTRNNQKAMFNLTIKLEVNAKENILY